MARTPGYITAAVAAAAAVLQFEFCWLCLAPFFGKLLSLFFFPPSPFVGSWLWAILRHMQICFSCRIFFVCFPRRCLTVDCLPFNQFSRLDVVARAVLFVSSLFTFIERWKVGYSFAYCYCGSPFSALIERHLNIFFVCFIICIYTVALIMFEK